MDAIKRKVYVIIRKTKGKIILHENMEGPSCLITYAGDSYCCLADNDHLQRS